MKFGDSSLPEFDKFPTFKEPRRIHLQSHEVKEDSLTPRMMALRSVETAVTTHPKTQRHFADDLNLQQQHCEMQVSNSNLVKLNTQKFIQIPYFWRYLEPRPGTDYSS